MEEKHLEEKHLIDALVFEIAFGPELAAEAEAEALSALIQEALLPVLEAVFAQVSQTRGGSIDQLTIDLGVIDAKNFRESLKTRLSLFLKSALEEKLPLSTTRISVDRALASRDADLALLETFLIKGHLPSKYFSEKIPTVDEMLRVVLSGSAEAFVHFLQKSKHQAQVLKRLLYQVSEDNLIKIVRLLSPLDSQRLLSLVKQLRQALMRIPESVLSTQVLAREIWGTFIVFLMKEKQGNLDEKYLINQIIQKIIAGNKTVETQVLEALRDANIPPETFMSGSEEKVEKTLALEALAKLKDVLRVAIQEGRPEILKEIWPSILRDHAGLLKSMLLDCGRAIAVRRVLARQFSDEMLSDIVWVIDPQAQSFVHEIVTRPALFRQMDSEQVESEDETLSQLWEFTLSYLIIERGSHFNQKAYLGSLLAQMAAHENKAYLDLLQNFMARLNEIQISSAFKNEMEGLLSELADEHDLNLNTSEPVSAISEMPESEKQAILIQAYSHYEMLCRAFFEKSDFHDVLPQPSEEAVILAVEFLTRQEPTLLLRFFRTLQVEAHGVALYRKAFSAPTLLKLIKACVSFRLCSESGFMRHDLMPFLEKQDSASKDLNPIYAQILFSLLQNLPIDLEAISEDVADLPHTELGGEQQEENTLDPEATRLHLLKAKISEALMHGRPQAIETLWPVFLQNQALWLRLALFSCARDAAVRQRLSKTFPDKMLLDIVSLVAPEAQKIVSTLVKQPHLFQAHAASLENEKTNKAIFWECTLGVLLVARGSRFNTKNYLSALIRQIASHRNARAQDLLLVLTEGFEAIEIANVAKSEILHILRELSQEAGMEISARKSGSARISETLDSETLADVVCQDLKSFLMRGLWPKKYQGMHGIASFLEMISRLFQAHPRRISHLFRELQSGGVFQGRDDINWPSEIFVRLIEVFLSLKNPGGLSGTSDFMQAMVQHAIQAEHQALYYQKVFACLIKEHPVDFEAICAQSQGRSLDEIPLETRELDLLKVRDIQAFSKFDKSVSQKPLSSETLLKTHFVLIEQTLHAQMVLSGAASSHFLKTLEMLLRSAPGALAKLLKRGLEDRIFAGRLIHLLPESLLVRVFLLLNPLSFDRVLRCADLIASATCFKKIALSPVHITRLKWQFIFQYLFEEGRGFYAKTFVRLFTERLAKDAYYSDVIAFRLLLRAQLESHQVSGMKHEIESLMEVFSQIDQTKSSNLPLSEKNMSSETPAYSEEVVEEWDETVYLKNAGLVIVAPYLQRFFKLLGLTERQAFKSPEATHRAVHLLQFLVDERVDTPEYELVFNKILCGMKPAIPIPREITISAHEKKIVEGLLKGMITNWTQIGETSLQGFRESFLQREGTLYRKGDDWELKVQPKAFDILLDYIPWSFSLVKLPWMEHVIHVKWRSGENA